MPWPQHEERNRIFSCVKCSQGWYTPSGHANHVGEQRNPDMGRAAAKRGLTLIGVSRELRRVSVAPFTTIFCVARLTRQVYFACRTICNISIMWLQQTRRTTTKFTRQRAPGENLMRVRKIGIMFGYKLFLLVPFLPYSRCYEQGKIAGIICVLSQLLASSEPSWRREAFSSNGVAHAWRRGKFRVVLKSVAVYTFWFGVLTCVQLRRTVYLMY